MPADQNETFRNGQQNPPDRMVPPAPRTPAKPRRSWPRRIAKGAGIAAASVAGLAVLTVGIVLVGANTNPGRHFLERQTASLTGNTVLITGLKGRFPDALHVGRIELRDTKGVWLTIENLEFDWSPLRMIGRTARVDFVSADRLAIPRLPYSDPNQPAAPSTGPTKTGLSIDIRKVDARRIEVGAPLAGIPAVLALKGHAALPNLDALLNSPSFRNLPVSDIAIDLRRLDAAGTLTLAAKTDTKHVNLKLNAQDGKDGIVAGMTHMPDLAPVALAMTLNGPTDNAALDLNADAGNISATIDGKLNLLASTANITANLTAPAMTPGPTLSWQAASLTAKLSGPFTAPAGTADLTLDRVVAGGTQLGALSAHFDGMGQGDQIDLLHLHATASGLRIPGGNPTLLASAPLLLDVTYAPNDSTRRATLSVSHPLLELDADAATKPSVKGNAKLTLPDLAPFAAMGGQKLGGHTALTAAFALPDKSDPAHPGDTTTLSLNGDIAALTGLEQAVKMIGPNGKLAAHASMKESGQGDRTIHLDTFALDGKALHFTAGGNVIRTADRSGEKAAEKTTGKIGGNTTVDAQASLTLSALAAVAKTLRGDAKLDLTATGPIDDLAAKAHLASDFGTATMPKAPVTLDADVAHLPATPQGHITASGTIDRAPLALDATVAQDTGGTRHLTLTKLDWNSVHGAGKLDLPSKRKIPLGTLDLHVARLADLRNLIGQPISGALNASLKTTAATDSAPVKAAIDVSGNAAMAPYSIGSIKLTGTITDPEGTPDTSLALVLDRVAAPSVAGSLSATVKGPQTALATTAQARFSELYGAPGTLDLAAVASIPAQSVKISRLTGTAKGENLQLQAPATVSYGKTMGVDRLRATLAPKGITPASIDIAGTAKPALNLTASVKNVTPALAQPFAPTLHAAGTLSADAKLSGTLEAPRGTVSLTGRDLHMTTGDAASLAPARIDATADLAGATARIDAHASAGPKLNLEASGTVPTSKTGPIGLRTNGNLDLSLANAILGASGRQALGQVNYALNIAGTIASPEATGTVTLHNGDIQDFAQGLHLQDIDAAIVARHDSLVIQSFVAHTGKDGTISLSGSVGAFAPGMPVDLHLTANKAQPVASDLLTALINADIAIRGQADTRVDVAGQITLPHVEINIPNSMPGSVATLNVVRPGDKPPDETQKTSSRVIGLDLKLTSPGEFFVRGHGLDAEMAGNLHIGGTAATPSIEGGFDMRSGLFSFGGVTLNFTRGRVGFNGTGVKHKLDPTLDFEADRNVEGQTAMLKVTGYASNPKIAFESIPQLPQDQILAMLLFGTDSHSLSTTQMAEIGAALATLAGGSGFDPLGTVRKTLGLDRLAIGGGSGVNNGGTSIEAGKYVMKGVYVGAKQATSGSGTQAQVQVDLTKHLKLNTTVGTGGNVTGFTTPENDPGSSVGLLWQYRY
ncbi:translocation/assembly module TamB domain-containing protein [Acetobacter musti]